MDKCMYALNPVYDDLDTFAKTLNLAQSQLYVLFNDLVYVLDNVKLEEIRSLL